MICPYCNYGNNDKNYRYLSKLLCRKYNIESEYVNPGGRELGFPKPIGKIHIIDMCFKCDHKTIKKAIEKALNINITFSYPANCSICNKIYCEHPPSERKDMTINVQPFNTSTPM